jgi:hypothetical protein
MDRPCALCLGIGLACGSSLLGEVGSLRARFSFASSHAAPHPWACGLRQLVCLELPQPRPFLLPTRA